MIPVLGQVFAMTAVVAEFLLITESAPAVLAGAAVILRSKRKRNMVIIFLFHKTFSFHNIFRMLHVSCSIDRYERIVSDTFSIVSRKEGFKCF